MKLNVVIAGENALKFWLYEETSPRHVSVSFYAGLRHSIKQGAWPWLEDIVAAEASVTVFFNIMLADFRTVKTAIAAQVADLQTADFTGRSELITLPVKYGGDVGVDLENVARRTGLTVAEVVSRHQDSVFTVTAVGFSPGFGYLKGLHGDLCLPRRENPRTSVPQGAVAIAENYSAVYPQSSPGGWHLIGHCTEPLFDISLPVPALFKVGQQVKFIALD